MSPAEKIGDTVNVTTADHPPRSDSPQYVASRKWLMKQAGGCYICGGPVDLSHPGAPESKGMQDHHGGGLFHEGALVGFNLFPLEWSMGWGQDPAKVTAFIRQLLDAGLVSAAELATAGITLPLADIAAVMRWVDSRFNANVRLCAPHHVGHQTQHTPDANGHEAVGIHNAPWPILAAQAAWDWTRGDMWGGSTGTVAVSPKQDGSSAVTYVHSDHPGELQVGQILPPTHPISRAVHTPVDKAA